MSNNYSNNSLSNLVKGGFFTIFFATGFSALIFQIIWQRVLTIHAGVDLYSVTTVIAAFMAGLGLGSLLGGYIADRLSIRNCFVFFIVSNCAIGIFGFFSLWLFYDIYNSLIPYLESTMKSFVFHFVLLCIPTTLMGLSLPLLTKALVRKSDEIASMVGSLYGINTFGAAIGAGIGTWYMLGTFGFVVNIQIASSINVACALIAAFLLSRLRSEDFITIKSNPVTESNVSYANNLSKELLFINKPNFWILIYGLTGFAALSLEIVWFRILNVIAKSHSYVFGHLLFVYLCGVGLGSLISSRMIKRIQRPDKVFLWMQYSIGLLCLLCPLFLISFPKPEALTQFINKLLSWGIFETFNLVHFIKYFISINIIAVFIFGISTVLMGACFPLIQRIVSRQMDTIGRSISKLLFSNIVGNILGTIVTGFFLLDYLGTSATLKVLALILLIPGIIAGIGFKRHVIRFLSIALVSLISIFLIIIFPKEKEFWKFFHVTDAEIFIEEDSTSVNALIENNDRSDYSYEMRTNGHSFTSYLPFRANGNSSKIGIAPALYHPNPKTGLVIGFGSGNTLYSMAIDKRLEKITCIELSGGQIKLLKQESWRKDLWQVDKLFNDPRIDLRVEDGRKFLLHSKEKYDLIEMDPFHPMVAYTGNLFSVEFFEIIRQHLKPGGIFSQWIATSRVERNLLKVYPYVVRVGKHFALASNDPITVDSSEILARLKNFNFIDAYSPGQGQYLMDFFATNVPAIIQAGEVTEYSDEDLSFDLFPKDEYFLNNINEKTNLRKPIQ